MGVIRWEEIERGPYDDDGVMWHGYLGDDCICFVADFGPSVEFDGVFHLFTHSSFPGLRYDSRRTRCDNVEQGKHLADMLLLEWMTDVGFVFKAEFDEARHSCGWFISALRDVEAASKRRYEESAMLREELADIKSTAEFSRECYSHLNQKHVEPGNDYLELLRAVGKIKKIAGEVA